MHRTDNLALCLAGKHCGLPRTPHTACSTGFLLPLEAQSSTSNDLVFAENGPGRGDIHANLNSLRFRRDLLGVYESDLRALGVVKNVGHRIPVTQSQTCPSLQYANGERNDDENNYAPMDVHSLPGPILRACAQGVILPLQGSSVAGWLLEAYCGSSLRATQLFLPMIYYAGSLAMESADMWTIPRKLEGYAISPDGMSI